MFSKSDKLRTVSWPLVAIVLVSLSLRFLWLYAPVILDEADGGYVAMLWKDGYALYSYSHAFRTPLWYLMYLVSIQFFRNTIIPIRILNDFFFILSLIVLYYIVKNWVNEKAGLFTAFFYGVFMNVPAYQGQLAIPISLVTPFLIFATYFFNEYLKRGKKFLIGICGLLISAAFLILQDQLLVILPFLLTLSSREYKKFQEGAQTRKELTQNLICTPSILIGSLLIPVLVATFYFWTQGEIISFIDALIARRALSEVYIGASNVPFGIFFLVMTEGLPLWFFSLLGAIYCIRQLTKYRLFLLSWTLIALIRALIPPQFGQHFLYLVVPASILSGIALSFALPNFGSIREKKLYPEKATRSFLLLVILIISFFPSLYLSSQQYPTTNINWEFIRWHNTVSASYEEQQQVAKYIMSHVRSDEQILIHGWSPELYWLSGHKAPSIYVCSYNLEDITIIPLEEYNRLLEMVQNRTFSLITFFPHHFYPDAIMEMVQQKYYFATSIGTVQIYRPQPS